VSALAADGGSGFTPAVEKYLGDLVVKIVEHFLAAVRHHLHRRPVPHRFCRFSSGEGPGIPAP